MCLLLPLRRKKLEVEAHDLVRVAHTFGNPNIHLDVRLYNTGGRALKIRKISMLLSREGKILAELPARSYSGRETGRLKLFVPFPLQSGSQWVEQVEFFKPFDRDTDRYYRDAISALDADVKSKIEARNVNPSTSVDPEVALVEPFFTLFKRLFIWEPGNYLVELIVKTQPGKKTFAKSFRFDLHDSDTRELNAQTGQYGMTDRVLYIEEQYFPLLVPLFEVI